MKDIILCNGGYSSSKDWYRCEGQKEFQSVTEDVTIKDESVRRKLEYWKER